MAKAKDYTHECWNCGSSLMDWKSSYWQCRSCGASYVETFELGPPCVKLEEGCRDRPSRYRSVAIPERRARRAHKVNPEG